MAQEQRCPDNRGSTVTVLFCVRMRCTNETESIKTAIIKCVNYKYMYLKQTLLVHVAKYLLEGQTKNEEISVVKFIQTSKS